MDVQNTAINFAKTSGQFGAGVAGLTAGVFAMNQVPNTVPSYVRGSALMLLAYLGANTVGKEGKYKDYINALIAGMGAAGFLDLAKALTSGKTGVLDSINKKLPNLSGLANSFTPPPQGVYGLRGVVERKLLNGIPAKRLLVA